MGQFCEIALGAEPSSVRRARAFVAASLEAWQLGALREVATLLASELATNAVLYAGTPFRVAARLDDDAVTVEVADGRPWSAPASPPAPSERGRGLDLVARLASEWGVRPEGAGKVVWFVLPRR